MSTWHWHLLVLNKQIYLAFTKTVVGSRALVSTTLYIPDVGNETECLLPRGLLKEKASDEKDGHKNRDAGQTTSQSKGRIERRR